MDADFDQVFRLSAPCGEPLRRLFKAPLRLMSLLRYMHVELCAGGPVLIPAMAFPSMCVIVQGGVRLGGPDGLLVTEGFMRGPNQRPVRLEWLPGTSLIVAVMRVGRVGRLFDVPANELANRIVPLEFITAPGSVHQLSDAIRAGRRSAGLDYCVRRLAAGAHAGREPEPCGALVPACACAE
ncbi:hypothetical protein ACHMW6_28245 [Pseudoduganella sp. UC29_106]|uniref:hypothetical protein n=1 Tax=Pseudoduganella sp. UC29_106 TaxID=3374553 RepID=UPI00375699BC